MAKKRKIRNKKYTPKSGKVGYQSPINSTIILDIFSASDVERWKEYGNLLYSYGYEHYYCLQSLRAADSEKIKQALLSTTSQSFNFNDWARVCDYKWNPLSCAGSLLKAGGRFNYGQRIDPQKFLPFPAFYLASDINTAWSEKFQSEKPDVEKKNGVSFIELDLADNKSLALVSLKGSLQLVFDATKESNLRPLIEIIKTYHMSHRAKELAKKLKMKPPTTVTSTANLLAAITYKNWRDFPTICDIPASPQIFGKLLVDAGIEGIIYPSARSSGKCLAVFPDNLLPESYIELNEAPKDLKITRLDTSTQKELCTLE